MKFIELDQIKNYLSHIWGKLKNSKNTEKKNEFYSLVDNLISLEQKDNDKAKSLFAKYIITNNQISVAKNFFGNKLNNHFILDKNYQTPLHWAANLDRKGIAKILLDRGAYVGAPDINGNTPLHLAIASGNAEITKALIENGADITLKNKDRVTPLELALKINNIEMLSVVCNAASRKIHEEEKKQFLSPENPEREQTTKLSLESRRGSSSSVESFNFDPATGSDIENLYSRENLRDEIGSRKMHDTRMRCSDSSGSLHSLQGIPAFS